MSELITCTPRTIPPERRVEAARVATGINPQNQPDVEGLGHLMPGAEPTPDALAIVTAKYWGLSGVRLTVGFLDNPPAELRTKILSHMNAWNATANVEFGETTAEADVAEVRISRERMDDPRWDGYWSFLGTDIKVFSGPNNQTMNLQECTMSTPDAEFYRVVRHETGHTLGFPHEHMRRELVDRIDREMAISYYAKHVGWDRDTVIRQVLTPIEESSIRASDYADPNSIMCYQVPGGITKDGETIAGGLDIDESDYRFIAQIYPKAIQ